MELARDTSIFLLIFIVLTTYVRYYIQDKVSKLLQLSRTVNKDNKEEKDKDWFTNELLLLFMEEFLRGY